MKEDAVELLKPIYDRCIEGSRAISQNDVVNMTSTPWPPNRINNAIEYLDDLGHLKIEFAIGTTAGVRNFTISGLNPSGIDMIENRD